jgi:hypothetical protein
MAITWGSLNLNVTENNYNDTKQLGGENDLIPYIGITTAQSVLLMSGRTRIRREVSGWATKTDFDSLETDYYNFTKKTIMFHDGSSITSAIIEELNGERKKGSTMVWYSAKFLEV